MKSNLKEKEAQKLSELLEKASNHPTMQAILAEEAAEVLRTRIEAAGKIEALTKEQDETIPKLQKVLAEEEAKFNKMKAAMDAASDEAKKAKAAVLNKSHLFEKAINKQREILIESAAPEIDEGILFFQEKLAWLRSPGRLSRTAIGAERNLFTMTKTLKQESNRAAVLSALEFCRLAIKELETMKLSPALDGAKIEKMKAGVPSIDVYSEVTGEKPLPRVNADPFAGMASDSALNWQKDNLMERAKKVLS